MAAFCFLGTIAMVQKTIKYMMQIFDLPPSSQALSSLIQEGQKALSSPWSTAHLLPICVCMRGGGKVDIVKLSLQKQKLCLEARLGHKNISIFFFVCGNTRDTSYPINLYQFNTHTMLDKIKNIALNNEAVSKFT